MALAATRGLPAFDPAIARGEFLRNRVVLQRARLSETSEAPASANNQEYPANNQKFMIAEATLPQGNRFAAAQQRARIASATRQRLPEFPARSSEDNEASYELQMPANRRVAGRSSVTVTGASERSEGEQFANEAVWGSVFQGSGTIDMLPADGGVMLAFGWLGSMYQLLLTIFPAFNEKINGGTLGRMLPQKFDLRSMHGWGQLVDAVFLYFWVFFILGVFVMFIVIGYEIVTNPMLGIRAWAEITFGR